MAMVMRFFFSYVEAEYNMMPCGGAAAAAAGDGGGAAAVAAAGAGAALATCGRARGSGGDPYARAAWTQTVGRARPPSHRQTCTDRAHSRVVVVHEVQW